MNDKTGQALTDALIDQIESAARASFQRHQRSVRGQILTAADNYDWHLLHAAYQAGIHALRAQLAEAQKNDARYRWIESQRRFEYCSVREGHLKGRLRWDIEWGFDDEEKSSYASLGDAIDAAKGESNGSN